MHIQFNQDEWLRRRVARSRETHSPWSISQCFSKAQFIRWMLPYGIWVCRDGRQILFDRAYAPIAQKYPGQPATMADPNEWVSFKTEEWFYDDSIREEEKRRRAVAVLESWDIADTVLDAAEQLRRFVVRWRYRYEEKL